ADWVIERLDNSHERKQFSCGKESLDIFLKTLVSQYERKRIGRTFVAVPPGEKRVLGYYTSAAGSFTIASLPEDSRKGLPKHPLPTIHLGRLAVDLSCQGKGLGETLLFHFLHKALEVAQDLGVFAVDLWAVDEQACQFYTRYGFIPLNDSPLHFYLPLATVAKMFAP